ncbi:hypothetical protein BO70DRAFT_111864 [Aspergillus heteromorphus CBS 117.55]|uniref:Uncharacterized protein n=1 Tax=Aspergillus heteromorphus CBS 117.55 TaxID=1448321 RepID=A0A317VLH7_9EURO|nr:uncharacterized protein BO70DRAFT_111864 [Aspergillus heteromorphus CBS 117.55]PWY73722.1 hypothetical protein BO70DRAFT_111864 [Aspergillus heteromorphus CBS 117.55]
MLWYVMLREVKLFIDCEALYVTSDLMSHAGVLLVCCCCWCRYKIPSRLRFSFLLSSFLLCPSLSLCVCVLASYLSGGRQTARFYYAVQLYYWLAVPSPSPSPRPRPSANPVPTYLPT